MLSFKLRPSPASPVCAERSELCLGSKSNLSLICGGLAASIATVMLSFKGTKGVIRHYCLEPTKLLFGSFASCRTGILLGSSVNFDETNAIGRNEALNQAIRDCLVAAADFSKRVLGLQAPYDQYLHTERLSCCGSLCSCAWPSPSILAIKIAGTTTRSHPPNNLRPRQRCAESSHAR
jgi:hypothetical protein